MTPPSRTSTGRSAWELLASATSAASSVSFSTSATSSSTSPRPTSLRTTRPSLPSSAVPQTHTRTMPPTRIPTTAPCHLRTSPPPPHHLAPGLALVRRLVRDRRQPRNVLAREPLPFAPAHRRTSPHPWPSLRSSSPRAPTRTTLMPARTTRTRPIIPNTNCIIPTNARARALLVLASKLCCKSVRAP